MSSKKLINQILVDLFKQILTIEEKSLRIRGIKDVSMVEIHTIEAIGEGEKTMSEVATKLGISLGTLTTCITRLLNKGYVDRRRDDKDRRLVLVSLTKKGEEVNRVHDEFHDDMINHMMSELKVEEDAVLLNSLINIQKFFENEYGGKDEHIHNRDREGKD